MGPPPGLRHASDQDVVASILDGSAEACRELHRRYQARVYALALRMVHEPDAANDVTQDTFLKAFEGLKTYRPELPFWPWIGAIASHTAVDHIRHQRRDTAARQAWLLETTPGRRLTEGIPAIDQTTSDPFNVDLARLRQELEEALPQLQEEYRRCYERRDLERQSYQRIAKELRMSEGTARKNVNRARRKLRQILGSIRRFLLENTPV